MVDCGKEGLHSTALPLTLSQPIINNNSSVSINSNGKKENSDKANFLERNMEKEVDKDKDKDKDKGDMKTSWSLSLSPWRVMFTPSQMFKRRFAGVSLIITNHHFPRLSTIITILSGFRGCSSNFACGCGPQPSLCWGTQLWAGPQGHHQHHNRHHQHHWIYT